MSTSYPYYIVWTGALHLGDTPGVFIYVDDAADFVGEGLVEVDAPR